VVNNDISFLFRKELHRVPRILVRKSECELPVCARVGGVALRWDNLNILHRTATKFVCQDEAAKRAGGLDFGHDNHHRKDDECASGHDSLRSSWKSNDKLYLSDFDFVRSSTLHVIGFC